VADDVTIGVGIDPSDAIRGAAQAREGVERELGRAVEVSSRFGSSFSAPFTAAFKTISGGAAKELGAVEATIQRLVTQAKTGGAQLGTSLSSGIKGFTGDVTREMGAAQDAIGRRMDFLRRRELKEQEYFAQETKRRFERLGGDAGIKELSRNLVAAQAKAAAQGADDFLGIGKTGRHAKEAAASFAGLLPPLKGVSDGLADAEGRTTRFGSGIRGVTSAVNLFRAGIIGFVGYELAQGVAGLARLADQADNARQRFEALTSSVARGGQLMSGAIGGAEAVGGSPRSFFQASENLRDPLTRLRSGIPLGADGGDFLGLLGRASRGGGATTEGADTAVRVFTEAIRKGLLDQRVFAEIEKNSAGLARAIAESYGKTVDRFSQDLERGASVRGSDVARQIQTPQSVQRINDNFLDPRNDNRLERVNERLSAAGENFALTIDKATGASEAFKGALNGMTGALNTASKNIANFSLLGEKPGSTATPNGESAATFLAREVGKLFSGSNAPNTSTMAGLSEPVTDSNPLPVDTRALENGIGDLAPKLDAIASNTREIPLMGRAGVGSTSNGSGTFTLPKSGHTSFYGNGQLDPYRGSNGNGYSAFADAARRHASALAQFNAGFDRNMRAFGYSGDGFGRYVNQFGEHVDEYGRTAGQIASDNSFRVAPGTFGGQSGGREFTSTTRQGYMTLFMEALQATSDQRTGKLAAEGGTDIAAEIARAKTDEQSRLLSLASSQISRALSDLQEQKSDLDQKVSELERDVEAQFRSPDRPDPYMDKNPDYFYRNGTTAFREEQAKEDTLSRLLEESKAQRDGIEAQINQLEQQQRETSRMSDLLSAGVNLHQQEVAGIYSLVGAVGALGTAIQQSDYARMVEATKTQTQTTVQQATTQQLKQTTTATGLQGIPVMSGVNGFVLPTRESLAASSAATFAGGFDTGGTIRVGGSGGIDGTLIALRANTGEEISVRRPDQRGGGETPLIIQNFDVRGASPRQVRQSRGEWAQSMGAALGMGSRA
jgi:tape measure domain-containing protein